MQNQVQSVESGRPHSHFLLGIAHQASDNHIGSTQLISNAALDLGDKFGTIAAVTLEIKVLVHFVFLS